MYENRGIKSATEIQVIKTKYLRYSKINKIFIQPIEKMKKSLFYNI